MRLRIVENARSFEADVTGPLVLGRQQATEEGPYRLLEAPDGEPDRLIVAWNSEPNLARKHLLLEPLPDGRVRVTNQSRWPLLLPGRHEPVPPKGGRTELSPPFSLSLERRTVSVYAVEPVADALRRLDRETLAPGARLTMGAGLAALHLLGPQVDQLVSWLQLTMGVLQSAIGSADFLAKAAEALVAIVGLHSGRALRWEADRWAVAASHGVPAGAAGSWQPSSHVQDCLRRERCTVWHHPRQRAAASQSLEGLHTVVAAPLLGAGGDVIGALYGELRRDAEPRPRDIGQLEALLVELLACGVSAGLARQEQERAALREQTLFEQFFSPQLARRLRTEPDLLQGRTETLTILFCDIRGSCAASRLLGPTGTMRWIGDVLGELSRCVLAEEGVLVDYIGDELMAMWGAPERQADHAERATRAALAMLRALAPLNKRWAGPLGGPMGLGVGLNTGKAEVGNTGTPFKFKYGALGDTVNVASRAQGLTKYLKRSLLMTQQTRSQLGPAFAARRVVKTRLVNIDPPVDLYEVTAAGEEVAEFFRASEEALGALEGKDFAQAARRAGALLEQHPGDGPLQLVLSRAAEALMRNGEGFDPVWTPPGK